MTEFWLKRKTKNSRQSDTSNSLCRGLTLSAIPLSFLHLAQVAPGHMLAPKRRQTIRYESPQGDA